MLFLDRVDGAPISNDEFSFEFNQWISVLIDALNEIIVDIQDQLNGLGTATYITPLTTVEIMALIGMNASPVLPLGSLWFDTTLGKLRVLTTMAVSGVSNGVTQVVTSV